MLGFHSIGEFAIAEFASDAEFGIFPCVKLSITGKQSLITATGYRADPQTVGYQSRVEAVGECEN